MKVLMTSLPSSSAVTPSSKFAPCASPRPLVQQPLHGIHGVAQHKRIDLRRQRAHQRQQQRADYQGAVRQHVRIQAADNLPKTHRSSGTGSTASLDEGGGKEVIIV